LRVIGLAILLSALNAGAATLYGQVVHVVDGDTLDVIVQKKRIRVRILDIDAPERDQPIGHRSRQSLIPLCSGEAAQVDGEKHDRNGRMLAHVRCNGVDAGSEQ
jgi:endonuclease YncB( thermonuclease family)